MKELYVANYEKFYFDKMVMKKKFNMLMHIHNCNEIYYLIDGNANYIINGKKYEVLPGSLVFIPTAMPHKTFLNEGDFVERYVINFDDSILKENFMKLITEDLFGESPVLIIPTKKKSQVETIFGKIENEYKQNDEFSELIKNNLLCELIVLITRFCRNSDLLYTETYEMNNIKKIINYIEQNYSLNLSLKDLADYIGYSQEYTSRYVKKMLGSTFSVYLNSIRLKHAIEYLKTSDYSVTEVAMMCGFSNGNYFTKIFKASTNMTPHNFQKAYRIRNK